MQKDVYIIGISGGSGSGKSCVIRDIKKHCDPGKVCVVSQDNYYKPRESQAKDENQVTNFDLPTCIDSEALYKDVQRLCKGEKVERTEYAFNNAEASPSTIIMSPAPVIVIEGLFVFYEESLSSMMNLKVFVEAKENLKLIRRIKRDAEERNYPTDDVLYRYEHHVLPSFEKYIFPYKKDCDLVINNNASYKEGLDVLLAFIHHKSNT